MVFVPFLQSIDVQIRGVMDNQRVANTLGFRYFELIGPGPLSDLAASLNQWWTLHARPLLPSSYQFAEVYAYMLDGPNSAAVTDGANAGWIGNRGSIPMPNNVSLAIKFNTNRRGRSYTGRNYWAGFTESDVALNTITDPIADYIVALYERLLWLAPPDFPSGWTWCVNSRYNGGEARLQGASEPITAVSTTDRIVDSQRRRLPGRGK
jgi:hypothetical protein